MRQIITKGLAIYTDVPTLRPGTFKPYAFAFVSAGVAVALQVAIDPYLAGAHYITFFLAVVATSLIGGFGAALFCLALSAAAVDFFLLQPRFAFYVDLVEVPSLLLFSIAGLSTVILITGMRFAGERKRLQANKDRLQWTLDAARLGSWRYDARHRVFSWDARSKEIFGVPEDGAAVEEFMNWVHPDDVEKVWAAYHRALDPAQPERSPTQFRLRRGDGKVRWVETQGLTCLEGARREQQVVGFIGTVCRRTLAHARAPRRRRRVSPRS
jgi:PAS domain S-box-containing protein